ncbi:response regulator [Candidatus Nomurabacteria bacterium]|nr:response regulator [Candidatus Nomurabacteria bacterium]
MVNVLLIDDEEDYVLRPVALMLRALGARVVTAINGEIGVELATSPDHDFGLIVCDVLMPGLSGVDVLLALRALGVTTPFVFHTGDPGGYRDQVKDLVDRGEAAALLNKPSGMEVFELLLDRVRS